MAQRRTSKRLLTNRTPAASSRPRKRGLFGGTPFVRFQEECKKEWASRYCSWRGDEINAGRISNRRRASGQSGPMGPGAKERLEGGADRVSHGAQGGAGPDESARHDQVSERRRAVELPNKPVYIVREEVRLSNSFGVPLDSQMCIAVHEDGKHGAAIDCGQLQTAGIIALRGGDFLAVSETCGAPPRPAGNNYHADPILFSRNHLAMACFAALIASIGCSMGNREGPIVTCKELADGQFNACKEGIIARCNQGKIEYEVCTESTKDVSASEICEQPWQTKGQYACENADAGTGQ